MDLRKYIEDRCIPEPNSGCWLWLLSVGSHGYGNASPPWSRVDVAHRVSYVAFKGEIPDGMLVQHSCDNRICVNPDHLSLGTDKSNCDDKIRKGRGGYDRRDCGRRVPPDLALAIRVSREPHAVTARRTGLTQKSIAKIRSGKTHARIPPDTIPALLPLLPEQVAQVEEWFRAANENEEPDVLSPEVVPAVKLLKEPA